MSEVAAWVSTAKVLEVERGLSGEEGDLSFACHCHSCTLASRLNILFAITEDVQMAVPVNLATGVAHACDAIGVEAGRDAESDGSHGAAGPPGAQPDQRGAHQPRQNSTPAVSMPVASCAPSPTHAHLHPTILHLSPPLTYLLHLTPTPHPPHSHHTICACKHSQAGLTAPPTRSSL